MSNQPPPYPGTGDDKGGYPPSQPGYGPPPQPGYGPPPQPGYGPPQAGYPPPQPGYPPSQPGQAHSSTVVVAQPAVTVIQTFQAVPVRTTCPHCRADIVTAVHYESGTFSWLICVLLCILGCNLGCCLIPFCVEGCQDAIHTCPNCHQMLSRWSRM